MRFLEDILLEKREALNEILQITKKQPGCIASDDTDELLNCIASRQHLVDVVNMLDREAQTATTDDQPMCEQIRREIQKLLGAVAEQDRQNEALATAKLEEYRGMIKNCHEGSRSLGAYANHLEQPRSSYDVKQ